MSETEQNNNGYKIAIEGLQDIYRDLENKSREHGHKIATLETKANFFEEISNMLKADLDEIKKTLVDLRIHLAYYVGGATAVIVILQYVFSK